MSQLQSELSNYRLGHTEKWVSTQSLGKASKNGTTPRMQYRRSEHQQPRMAFATPVHYLGGSQGLTRLPYQLGGQWGRIETHSPGTCDPTMPSPQTPCWSMGFESASFTICSFFFFYSWLVLSHKPPPKWNTHMRSPRNARLAFESELSSLPPFSSLPSLHFSSLSSHLPSFLPLSLPFPPIRFEKISYHPLLSVSINIFLFTACSETSPLFSILYLGLFPYLLKEVLSSIDIVRFQEIGVIPITLKITAPSLSEGNQARSSSLWRMCGFGQRLVVMQTRCSSGKGGPGTWERVGESPWGCLAGETGPGWKEAQKWDGHGLHRKIDEPR